ncbi:porin [Hydrogenophaga sp.]|uniref:porin n=1 Tax=Hydrogenophaga sp. TaxID=1904254 RepID=UPI002FC7F778
MLRTPLIAGLIAAGSLAHAQSTVTIYGIADTGVERLTNVNAAGGSLTRMPNLTGTVPSRLGFRGTEDLGGGLQAFLNLETGIALDSGSLNNGGRLFGRASNVGLAGPFGRITLGRQINMTVLAVSSHVMGPSLYSFASHDAYIPNAINDNAIGYLKNFSGFTVGATYSLGRDVSAAGGPAGTNCPGESGTDRKACRQWTVLAKYDSANWGAAVSHDVMRGGPGAAFGMTSSAHTDKRTVLSGWGKLGPAKISGGILHRERDNAAPLESNLVYVGASYPLTPALTLDAEYSRMDVKASPNDATMLVARSVYSLSKRTAVYAMVGRIKNKGASATSVSAGGTVGAGMGQTGLMMGVRHTF